MLVLKICKLISW